MKRSMAFLLAMMLAAGLHITVFAAGPELTGNSLIIGDVYVDSYTSIGGYAGVLRLTAEISARKGAPANVYYIYDFSTPDKAKVFDLFKNLTPGETFETAAGEGLVADNLDGGLNLEEIIEYSYVAPATPGGTESYLPIDEAAEADRDAAQEVMDMISALNPLSATYATDVVAANEAYKALTPEQKALVTNSQTLENAVAALDEAELALAMAKTNAKTALNDAQKAQTDYIAAGGT